MSNGIVQRADNTPTPAGFRETNTGLVVPEAFSREREVWLRHGEEDKAFGRAQRLAARKGLRMPLVCYASRCANNPLGCTLLRRVNVPGGYELHCEHKVRVCLA